MDEALQNIIKANEIIDKKEGDDQNPMLFGWYRFLKAKVLKLRNENIEALKSVDEAIAKVKESPELKADEHQMTEYRYNIIYAMSDEELSSFGLKIKDIQEEEKQYKEKVT